MAESHEQFDLYEPGDREQRGRVLLRRAAKAYGESDLATGLHLDGKTLDNQLARRRREDKNGSIWKLSEDAVLKLFFDETHVGRALREGLLGLINEEILDTAAITPEQALRDIVVMALAGEFGNSGREKVISLSRKVVKKAELAP